ncbi:MAG TPA: DUF6122 family protein [Flavobacteriales bacterium]
MNTLAFWQPIIHYSMHLLVPGAIANIFYRNEWKKAWLLFLTTMLVDLDHLLATPIFDPSRCSIGFHPLHSYYAIVVYFLAFLFIKNKNIRILALGLWFHMFTDAFDCYISSLVRA